MAYTVDQAFFLVICNGVRCDFDECELVRRDFDECELAGTGCAFGRTDKKILADIARRRYEKREKTPSLEECMRIINKAFPRGAKVV